MSELKEQFSRERRLHWLSIIYQGIMRSPAYLIAFYFALAQQDFQEMLFIFIALGFGIFTIPMIILRYFYFTFFISEDEIVIRSGVFSRKQRNIPIKRIQNIGINQNFLQRILGIAHVRIETAGGTVSEGNLEYVSRENAEDIRKVIREYQHEIGRDNKEAEEAPLEKHEDKKEEKEKILYSMSLKDNVLYGMLRFRPVMFILIAWLFGMAQQFRVIPNEEELIDHYLGDYAEQVIHFDVLTIILFIVGTLAVIMLLSWFADIFLTVNQYFGFTLTLDGDKLHTERGLLGRIKATIPLKKLQMMMIETNPIKQKFGFYGLQIQTAGFGESGKGAEAAVPFARSQKVLELSKGIRKYTYPEEFQPVSRKTIRRAFIRYTLLFLPFAGAGIWITSYALWSLLFIPLIFLAAYLRWKYRGFKIYEDTVLIKEGYWFRKRYIVPIEKIQTLNVYATFFQRRLDLGTLHIDTAAGGITGDARIIDIDISEAEDIRDRLSDAFHKLHAKQLKEMNVKFQNF